MPRNLGSSYVTGHADKRPNAYKRALELATRTRVAQCIYTNGHDYIIRDCNRVGPFNWFYVCKVNPYPLERAG